MILLERDVYDETIAIIRNEKNLADIFIELKELIYKQFKVTAINFVYERIKYNNPENRYSLNILLLNKGDYQKMCDGPYGGYRKSKQKYIAEKFFELALRHNFDVKEHIADIWICYTDFYSELRAETNSIASAEAIAYIKREYPSLPIWLICPQFSCVVVFYETDKHVIENNQNGMNVKLKQDYFSILKKYDEFECCDYDSFQVFFDSKEALDRYYEGNLFYYFK